MTGSLIVIAQTAHDISDPHFSIIQLPCLLKYHLSPSLIQFDSWEDGMLMHRAFSTFARSMFPKRWAPQISYSCSTLYPVFNMFRKSSHPPSTMPYWAHMSRLRPMSHMFNPIIMLHLMYILFMVDSPMYK